MQINDLCKRYGKGFILNKNKTLKDLEPYGFKPTYDQNTGELIRETLWLEGGIYGERPLMEITNREMDPEYFLRETSMYSPLKSFVMNFHDWFYGEYSLHRGSRNKELKIEIEKIDTVIFNVLIDLIEDGVIERKKVV